MTLNPEALRAALIEMTVAFSEGAAWNEEQRTAYEKARKALAALPQAGEAEPVAYQPREVGGAWIALPTDGADADADAARREAEVETAIARFDQAARDYGAQTEADAPGEIGDITAEYRAAKNWLRATLHARPAP